MVYQWNTQRTSFYISIIALLAAILFEYLYRKIKGREIKHKEKEHKA
jgi:uncharacterized membrane protein